MDSYQPIYDAVRSYISQANANDVIADAVLAAFDRGNAAGLLAEQIAAVGYEHSRPSAVYRPKISLDGNSWCALYGDNLQDGVAGFGKTPAEAMAAFDKAWLEG